jgi:alpha-tubulin suppressor-like RCC1 family protein
VRFAEIDAGFPNACALSTAGVGYCWGNNQKATLGYDSGQVNYPVPVATLGQITAIRTGNVTSCAVDASGVATCWGNNNYGVLGLGFLGGVYKTPQGIYGSLSMRSISVGGEIACGVTVAGVGYCWGHNWKGGVGDGTSGLGLYRTSPTPVANPPIP